VKRSRRVIVAAGFALILGAQCIFTIVLATPNGVRIHSPQPGFLLDRSFVVSGDAWARSPGLAGVRVEAAPADQRAGGVLTFTASRDAVKSRGAVLFLLSTWSVKITLPSDGSWELRGVAVDASGREIATPPRVVQVRAGAPVREFRSWTAEHGLPVLLILILAIALGVFARGGRGTGPRPGAAAGGLSRRFSVVTVILACAVWANELSYQLYWFFAGGWSVSTALMIQMCGLSILFLPVMFFTDNEKTRQAMFDILWFWGIGGAVQALIAPDIGANGFPAFRYFSFFVSHGLIIIMTVTMAIAGRVTITLRSFLRALVFTNIVLIPMYGIDKLIGLIPPYDMGNYFVLGYPPPTGSIVDLFADIFGPSPRYVVGLELMGLAVFLLLYVPWPLARLARRMRGGKKGQ
jgi:hypothetical integral membrane protein (TIGR02206 family)